jgi:hypothetical protein
MYHIYLCYKVLRWAFVHFYLFDTRYIVYDLSAFDCNLPFSFKEFIEVDTFTLIIQKRWGK